MKKKSKTAKSRVARTPEEIASLLDLSPSDAALMKHKADLSRIAVKAIADAGFQVNEIVRRAGVARSKVSAVKNGATVSVSIDLLIRIIAATGTRLIIRAA